MGAQADIVDTHLRGCLPPGTPPSYRSIIATRSIGKGRRRVIEADLIMFDGLPGKVRVSQHGPELWSHCYFELPGGDVSFEDGAWCRVPREEIGAAA